MLQTRYSETSFQDTGRPVNAGEGTFGARPVHVSRKALDFRDTESTCT